MLYIIVEDIAKALTSRKKVVLVVFWRFTTHNPRTERSLQPRACKVMGVSRGTFYRFETGCIDALINQSRRTPNLKNRVDSETEQSVLTGPSNSLPMGKLKQATNYVNWVYLSLQVVSAQPGFATT